MILLDSFLGVTTHKFPCGGWLPENAEFFWQRADQGRDFITNWRGVIQAPGSGECVGVGSDRPFPNGFGPRYAIVRMDTGAFAGHEWYLGHCTSLVGPRERFGWGHPLARADQGDPHTIGVNISGGWVELGQRQADGSLGPNNPNGHWYDSLLRNPEVIKTPNKPIIYGEHSRRVSLITKSLLDCGWIDKRRNIFDSHVHGAIVAFKEYHHLPIPAKGKGDRGVVDERTAQAIIHAGNWCKAHHRKEH